MFGRFKENCRLLIMNGKPERVERDISVIIVVGKDEWTGRDF